MRRFAGVASGVAVVDAVVFIDVGIDVVGLVVTEVVGACEQYTENSNTQQYKQRQQT